MAGILLRKKNIKIRYNKDRNYISYIISNLLLKDYYLDKVVNLKYLLVHSNKHFKNSSITKIKNKCLISGRNRSVLKKFRLSRMFFKNLGVSGYINGLRKASW
jgi:ribosomal protein S14